ncbi:MAG: MazG nucleotide pyrophosphohydrolase domain-containing protein, partial [Gemmatimonadota bacterium]
MNSKQSDALARVMDLVRFLRTHCPWDAAQTPRSLIPYLLEEAHESADAIAEGNERALRSELGDLLLNVAFQLVLGEERGSFDADAVADTVIEKMQRRHPHLYGRGEKEAWETLKAREREGPTRLLHGVTRSLDPLSKAHRIQDRVAAVGFDWEDARGAF